MEFVPYGAQISRLVELHFIRHDASAELLVGSILQIPARLGLLNKFPDNSPVLIAF
jgi:hypothetical protein